MIVHFLKFYFHLLLYKLRFVSFIINEHDDDDEPETQMTDKQYYRYTTHIQMSEKCYIQSRNTRVFSGAA